MDDNKTQPGGEQAETTSTEATVETTTTVAVDQPSEESNEDAGEGDEG